MQRHIEFETTVTQKNHNPCYVNHGVDKKLESNTRKAMHIVKRIIMKSKQERKGSV